MYKNKRSASPQVCSSRANNTVFTVTSHVQRRVAAPHTRPPLRVITANGFSAVAMAPAGEESGNLAQRTAPRQLSEDAFRIAGV